MQDNIKEKYIVLFDHQVESNGTARIRLLTENFRDVVISYGEIKFDEDENDIGYLHFEYNTHDPEDFDIVLYSEEEQKEFQTLLGDILVDMMKDSLEHMESKNNDRENNT